MAKKESTVYYCNECGFESSKWMGQCPACKAWNTFVEEKVEKKAGMSGHRKHDITDSMPVSFDEINTQSEERTVTGIGELLTNRLLNFDAKTMQFRTVPVKHRDSCAICGTNPTINHLIDYEQAACDLKH